MYYKKITAGAFALACILGFSAPTTHAANVVETAIEEPSLSTLVELVVAADLVATLSGEQDITVFAPTNDAFEKLPRVITRAIERDPAILTSILTYHVAGTRLRAEDVVSMSTISMLNGSEVRVNVRGDRVFLNLSRVTVADIETDNATVHLIDRVLLYPGIIRDVIRALRSH